MAAWLRRLLRRSPRAIRVTVNSSLEPRFVPCVIGGCKSSIRLRQVGGDHSLIGSMQRVVSDVDWAPVAAHLRDVHRYRRVEFERGPFDSGAT